MHYQPKYSVCLQVIHLELWKIYNSICEKWEYGHSDALKHWFYNHDHSKVSVLLYKICSIQSTDPFTVNTDM